MGWKMLISYIMRPRDQGGSGASSVSIYDIFNHSENQDPLDKEELNVSSTKKYGPGSPAFRRKGLLRRQG